MKQSLSTRLIALLCAVVVSSVLLESVAELGHPASNGQAAVATVAPAAAASVATLAAAPANTLKQF